MNILIVNRAFGTLFGGGESFDFNAAIHLKALGHNVIVITAKPLNRRANNQFDSLRVAYVGALNLRNVAYATERLSSILSAFFYHIDNLLFEISVFIWLRKQARESFDIVHCCSLFFLPTILLNVFKLPVISWLPGPPSGIIRFLLPWLLRNPNFGLFTHGSPEWVLNSMGMQRIKDYQVIEPGVDLNLIDSICVNRESMRKQLGIGAHDLVGITTARLVPVKNHLLLMSALAKAKEHGVLWYWLFIGDGILSSTLHEQANHLGIADQLHFLGYQPQSKVHSWLAVSDIFALTSKYESFSIATLEAMAHGLPVIGTDVGYLKTLIADSDSGSVVSPTNVDELAAVLIEYSNPQVRMSHGSSGRSFVESLDWPIIAKKLEAFYDQVINARF